MLEGDIIQTITIAFTPMIGKHNLVVEILGSYTVEELVGDDGLYWGRITKEDPVWEDMMSSALNMMIVRRLQTIQEE